MPYINGTPKPYACNHISAAARQRKTNNTHRHQNRKGTPKPGPKPKTPTSLTQWQNTEKRITSSNLNNCKKKISSLTIQTLSIDLGTMKNLPFFLLCVK